MVQSFFTRWLHGLSAGGPGYNNLMFQPRQPKGRGLYSVLRNRYCTRLALMVMISEHPQPISAPVCRRSSVIGSIGPNHLKNASCDSVIHRTTAGGRRNRDDRHSLRRAYCLVSFAAGEGLAIAPIDADASTELQQSWGLDQARRLGKHHYKWSTQWVIQKPIRRFGFPGGLWSRRWYAHPQYPHLTLAPPVDLLAGIYAYYDEVASEEGFTPTPERATRSGVPTVMKKLTRKVRISIGNWAHRSA